MSTKPASKSFEGDLPLFPLDSGIGATRGLRADDEADLEADREVDFEAGFVAGFAAELEPDFGRRAGAFLAGGISKDNLPHIGVLGITSLGRFHGAIVHRHNRSRHDLSSHGSTSGVTFSREASRCHK